MVRRKNNSALVGGGGLAGFNGPAAKSFGRTFIIRASGAKLGGSQLQAMRRGTRDELVSEQDFQNRILRLNQELVAIDKAHSRRTLMASIAYFAYATASTTAIAYFIGLGAFYWVHIAAIGFGFGYWFSRERARYWSSRVPIMVEIRQCIDRPEEMDKLA